MSEGDAAPVVYLEIESGRTGRIDRYRIPEGDPLWRQLRNILQQSECVHLGTFQRQNPAPREVP